MSTITTHVLDTAHGKPATGIKVILETLGPGGEWTMIGSGLTDKDGRPRNLMTEGTPLQVGTYRLTFDTATYFQLLHIEGFFPTVHIVFAVRRTDQHYHVPLLLSPHGYSTYRGS